MGRGRWGRSPGRGVRDWELGTKNYELRTKNCPRALTPPANADTVPGMSVNVQDVMRKFAVVFGRPGQGAVRAPGRVNLIGEHTDYNDGFVLPIAIERDTVAAWARRADRTIRFVSREAHESATVDLAGPVERGEPAWGNYCKGVAAGLIKAGVELPGVDILLAGDVPLGGGLSSSASLEVATGLALLAAAGAGGQMESYALAKICQKAEHEFAGAPCGIMDQAVAVLGQAGRAMLLDCRDGTVRQIPFDDPDVVVLVADTQVKHAISDGGYAARRDQCYAAAKKLGVKMLREADASALAGPIAKTLDAVEFKRARHVVGEIDRTLRAVEALEAGDYKAFGELMYASHASLRDDYEVSCEELDAMVASARGCAGVFGARMTGGGFGGCAIVLVRRESAEAAAGKIADDFEKRFARRAPIFATRAAAGAGTIL